MLSRRVFLKRSAQLSAIGLTSPAWLHLSSVTSFGQTATSGGYRAVVLITLPGGNDGNNTIIPLDTAEYREYATMRSSLALVPELCLPINKSSQGNFGLHYRLPNIASFYNSGKALVVANVGPMRSPATKAQLLSNPSLAPEGLLSHPASRAQWESATTVALPDTGWGGRMADVIADRSGTLPPVLNAGPASIFTVGHQVQGIVLDGAGGSTALPSNIDAAILDIAASDRKSDNLLVAEAAKLRADAVQQQILINQAQTSGHALQTQFPGSAFGNTLRAIAQTINGRDSIGATRQIFYCNQGSYDTHTQQDGTQRDQLTDLDQGLGAFMQALAEMGLTDQVLICTHSDFNRTMMPNSTGGTDHAWGNHQFILGGGIKGGQILGTMPTLEYGGKDDLNGLGTWIPTTSVTQMAASIGGWMGLSNAQNLSVFPDLGKFPSGALSLS